MSDNDIDPEIEEIITPAEIPEDAAENVEVKKDVPADIQVYTKELAESDGGKEFKHYFVQAIQIVCSKTLDLKCTIHISDYIIDKLNAYFEEQERDIRISKGKQKSSKYTYVDTLYGNPIVRRKRDKNEMRIESVEFPNTIAVIIFP